MKPRVVITNWVHPEVIEFLSDYEIIANPTKETLTRAQIIKLAQDAEALMVFMPDSIDAEFLRFFRT